MKRIFFFLLVIIPVFFPVRHSQACGYVPDDEAVYQFLNQHLLSPEVIKHQELLTFDKVVDYYEKEQAIQQTDNLSEWIARVCENALPEDAQYIIYEAPIEEIEALYTATKSKNMPVPYRLAKNTFAQYLHKLKCLDTLQYLLFAKQCEPHVLPLDRWNDAQRDAGAMQALIHEGRRQFKKINSHYIRLRYIYQLVRLAHYAGYPERALELYKDLMPKTDEKDSLIYWWILGHKAGALYDLEQRAEAAYLYSLIYRNSPSKRQSAYLSFDIKTQEEWEAAMLMCQSNDERANMHAIRASTPKARSLQAMKDIYALDPSNVNLEELLIKEIQQLEKELLGLSFNSQRKRNQRRFKIPSKDMDEYLIDMQAFARQVRSEGKVKRRSLWHIAEGYLELIAGDAYEAQKTFQLAAEEVTSEALREQLEVFQLAAKIEGYITINDEIENELYNIRKNDKHYREYGDFPDFMRDKLTDLYKKSGQLGKAFRCQNDMSTLRQNPKESVVDDLIKMVMKKDKTPLERLLSQNEDGNLIDDELWDLKTTQYMQEYQLEAALEMFKRIPRESWDDFGVFDPFRPTIKDCLQCPHSKDSIDLFNKGELLEKLLDLEYKARSGTENAAPFYFRIGVALYNMSYYGHSWNAMDYYRSGVNHRGKKGGGNVFYSPGAPKGNQENLNIDRALYYFEKSRLVAESPELAAKATYMAAKCELIKFYQSDQYRPSYSLNRIPEIPETFRENYNRLMQYYSETQFYQQVIAECKYFAAYASR